VGIEGPRGESLVFAQKDQESSVEVETDTEHGAVRAGRRAQGPSP
jgi:hypothetical protein